MKITKNWFYKLSEFNADQVIIDDNLIVAIFDDLNESIDVELWENSRVEFYSLIENKEELNINFVQKKESSILQVRCLLLSKDSNKIKTKIYSELWASNTKSDVQIISIVWNDWEVDLDWIIKINENVEKVDWNLNEENLFLGNTWKVNWIPTLLVRSDDVKASHACKMERISDDKLFYLRSRWVGRDNALSMMIEAKVKGLFSCISMLDNDFYEKLVDNILKKIK